MRYLQPSFCGVLACNFCLRSAFDVMSIDPLSSDVFLPLAALNFARGSFSPMLSAHAVWECSNFVTLDLHHHSVDDGSRPFQSPRFMYSCIRNFVGALKSLRIGHKRLDSLLTIRHCRQPELW